MEDIVFLLFRASKIRCTLVSVDLRVPKTSIRYTKKHAPTKTSIRYTKKRAPPKTSIRYTKKRPPTKTSIRYAKKRAHKINSDVCFTKNL